ncbi:Thiamine-phosphate synthase [Galdieria sulphuraria]|nr:Thiamine-phosphate synthase [Galdieria sulphuraria]
MIGGVSAIQLRDIEGNAADFHKAAMRLVKILNQKCPLIINRDIELALKIGASGVHFAESQLEDQATKETAINSQLLVGISVHSISSARKAVEWSPGYIQVGSVFNTRSHPGQQPLGLSRLREIRKSIPSSIQLVAVGGIHLENVHKVKKEGVSNIAVISAIAHNSNRVEYCRKIVPR